MHVRDYLSGCGSTFNFSIAQGAPQHAVNLVEIVIYDHSTVQCGCIVDLSRSSADFTFVWAKSARSAARI